MPISLVWYNVFSSAGRGPEIFGTEPWHFYLRNLLLNFNIWLVLALLSLPLVMLHMVLRTDMGIHELRPRMLTWLAPLYLWLLVLTAQPHKEERFMYPIYPAIAVNAAISLHIFLLALGTSRTGSVMSRIPAQIRLLGALSFISAGVMLGTMRIAGMVTAYSAPLQIWSTGDGPVANAIVCYGKDWHRFPSSFFLPNDTKASFVKSDFDGLLPGAFPDARTQAKRLAGIRMEPTGMNDENQEDLGKYVSVTIICPS